MHVCEIVVDRGLINRWVIGAPDVQLVHEDLQVVLCVGAVHYQNIGDQLKYVRGAVCSEVIGDAVGVPEFGVPVEHMLAVDWVRFDPNKQRDDRYFMVDVDCSDVECKHPSVCARTNSGDYVSESGQLQIVNPHLAENCIYCNVGSSELSPGGRCGVDHTDLQRSSTRIVGNIYLQLYLIFVQVWCLKSYQSQRRVGSSRECGWICVSVQIAPVLMCSVQHDYFKPYHSNNVYLLECILCLPKLEMQSSTSPSPAGPPILCKTLQ